MGWKGVGGTLCPPVSLPTGFAGACVEADGSQEITAQGDHVVAWSNVRYDVGDFWSQTDDEKLVVPAGIARVRLGVSLKLQQQLHMNRPADVRIVRNGQEDEAHHVYLLRANFDFYPAALWTPWIVVALGDTFEVLVEIVGLDGENEKVEVGAASWFAIEAHSEDAADPAGTADAAVGAHEASLTPHAPLGLGDTSTPDVGFEGGVKPTGFYSDTSTGPYVRLRSSNNQNAAFGIERASSQANTKPFFDSQWAQSWHGREYLAREQALDQHVSDTSNPHGVTSGQTGAPTQAEHDGHVANTDNPHGVTANQVGAVPLADGAAELVGGDTPSDPTAGNVRLYARDNRLYYRDAAGVEYEIGVTMGKWLEMPNLALATVIDPNSRLASPPSMDGDFVKLEIASGSALPQVDDGIRLLWDLRDWLRLPDHIPATRTISAQILMVPESPEEDSWFAGGLAVDGGFAGGGAGIVTGGQGRSRAHHNSGYLQSGASPVTIAHAIAQPMITPDPNGVRIMRGQTTLFTASMGATFNRIGSAAHTGSLSGEAAAQLGLAVGTDETTAQTKVVRLRPWAVLTFPLVWEVPNGS